MKTRSALLGTVAISASMLLPTDAIATAAPGSTAAVNQLMRQLSGGYTPADCYAIDIQPHQLARVQCGPNHDPGGPQLAIYTLYVDTTAMNAQYQVTLNDNIPLTFPDGTQSPSDWFFDQSQNQIAGSDALLKRPEDGVINMIWTNTSLRRLAVTIPAGDPADLQRWWYHEG